MKKISIIIILLCSLLSNDSLSANNEPVVVLKKEGSSKKIAVMYPAVEGPINLFYESTEVIEYKRISGQGFVPVTIRNVDVYYIGVGREVEQVNAGNYKRLVKKYLPDATDLHQRLGKRGFRFENIPSMVLYYNKRGDDKVAPMTRKEIRRLFES